MEMLAFVGVQLGMHMYMQANIYEFYWIPHFARAPEAHPPH